MAASPTSRTPFLPPRWVITTAWRAHRSLHRWSGGRFGLRLPNDTTYGLGKLTTTGRRTGQARSVMIGYFHDGDDIVTMAMNGWDPAEPAWWLNLQADPTAHLLTPDRSGPVVGRAAEGDDHDRLWQRWNEIDEELLGYAERRPGGTAVVILTPTGEA